MNEKKIQIVDSQKQYFANLPILIKEQEGKKLQLILDVKSRWNSLVTMIKRFIQIKDLKNKVLNELELRAIKLLEVLPDEGVSKFLFEVRRNEFGFWI